MAQHTKGSKVPGALAVGAGVAALGAAAYLLFGPEGKKNRKNLKSWMVKMKADVIEKIEDVKELTAPAYEKIVDEVESKYRAMKHIDPAELAAEVATIRKTWKKLQGGKKAKRGGAKKAAQKGTKKAAAKKARA